MGNAHASKAKASASASTEATGPTRRNYTLEQLKESDGTLVSLLGEVYDVSPQIDDMFGQDVQLRSLLGRDATRALATGSFAAEDIDSSSLEDLSAEQLASVDSWVEKLQARCTNVGRLLLPGDLTRDQLRRFNGVDDPRKTVLVGVDGAIYDVTLNGLEHYGPDGSYAQFAGRDASRALACMSFDDAFLDDPTLAQLTPEQRSALANWVTRFQQKYAVVGAIRAQ